MLAAASFRLFLALTHEPYLGIDGGAYVLSALEVLGRENTSVGFPRPPLAPGWLLAPFIHFLGIDAGYKLWTALFSLLPLLPVYLLARDLVSKSTAIFALGFMAVDLTTMEMMITGSLPLIGFSFMGLAIWCIIRLTERWSRLHFWLLAASIGILPYINQSAAGIAAYILPIFTIALFFLLPTDRGWNKCNIVFYVLPAAFLGVLIALGSLPWYLANLPGDSELRFPGPLIILVNWWDPAVGLHSPIAMGTAFLLWRSTKTPSYGKVRTRETVLLPPVIVLSPYILRAVAVVLAILGIVVLFLSFDEAVVNLLFRPRYFMAILVYPAIAYLLKGIWPMKGSLRKDSAVVYPMVIVWLFLFLWGQTFVFEKQTFFKDMVFPETVEALDIAKVERPDQAIITNAYSLSHWVAALNQVESPNTWSLEPSPYYKESDRHVRCLLGWVDGCDAQASAQTLDAGYILIDERMPDEIWAGRVYGSPSEDEWANLYSVPWLRLRYSEGTVRLWEINTEGS